MTIYPDDLVCPLTSDKVAEWLDTYADYADDPDYADDVHLMTMFRAECEALIGGDWIAFTQSEWKADCAELAKELYGDATLQRAWDDDVWAEECAVDAAMVDVGVVRYVVREQ